MKRTAWGNFPEAVAIGLELEKLERPKAKERQKKHGATAPGKRRDNTSGKFPEVNGDGGSVEGGRRPFCRVVGWSRPETL